ncbi:Pleckstrin homology domain-containing protein [Xylaria sp. FL0933]|nr:Pleckstrin homology domain-containing protein [Xylaria sp. FL0933]
MAEEQKPVAVPETTPAVAEPVVVPVVEAKPAEEKPAEEAPAAETSAEAAAEETPAAATAEETKEEVKPIEAGTLEHKGAPANFPKNLLYAKHHFWFGTDALEKEKLATYLKNEKVSEVGHHVVSWASETGKGLLFYGKESDKTTPTGVIQLSEASEPAVEGSNKFHFTSKGHKHTFKAPTTAERDNWVEQIKLKIAEAKELAATVTESETYKKTLESLKPAPAAKKEEKPAAPAAEAPKEETPAEAAEEAKETKEEDKEEEKKEEKKEEPKRRSASRKRASIFGLLGKKEEAKKEAPAEDKPAETEAAAQTEPTPIEQIIQATEAEAAPAEGTTEAAAAEETKEPAKPAPSKRASLFGSLSFGKKKTESESAPTTPAKEEAPAATEAPVAENAPVIPAVETTEPLTAEVASPAAASPEATEATPATNGETKKEVKNDKRKSSLPFAFGKKEKATSDEEGEKKSTPFFSKLRQTVKKSKPTEKSTEKAPEDTPAEDKPVESSEAAAEPTVEATDAKTEETKVEEPVAAPAVEETPVEKPAAAAPAPVTAAA